MFCQPAILPRAESDRTRELRLLSSEVCKHHDGQYDRQGITTDSMAARRQGITTDSMAAKASRRTVWPPRHHDGQYGRQGITTDSMAARASRRTVWPLRHHDRPPYIQYGRKGPITQPQYHYDRHGSTMHTATHLKWPPWPHHTATHSIWTIAAMATPHSYMLHKATICTVGQIPQPRVW